MKHLMQHQVGDFERVDRMFDLFKPDVWPFERPEKFGWIFTKSYYTYVCRQDCFYSNNPNLAWGADCGL